MRFIKTFEHINSNDVAIVGGKTASLGAMMQNLAPLGITIPNGFAITAEGYWHYVTINNLMPALEQHMLTIKDYSNYKQVSRAGSALRSLFINASMPDDLANEITQAYHDLSKLYGKKRISVAVRSSATAEDLPHASFAGQQETYLNVNGVEELLEACKQCLASLFTDRAIVYRYQKNFDYRKIALSIAVQKMVRSDKAVSGVAFSIDPETGFEKAIVIDASYGLGEAIVKGIVIPDSFTVFKPTLQEGFDALVSKKLGHKNTKIIYGKTGIKTVAVSKKAQNQFCITEQEVLELAKQVMAIEKYYSELAGSYRPLDIEWAKDGNDQKLYIVQARPETVHGGIKAIKITEYHLQLHDQKPLLTGQSIGQSIVTGTVRLVSSIKQIDSVQPGDIIVTQMTDPDWVPVLNKAAGIVTQMGGRTCHAAIVARELRIPALVGATDAMQILKEGTVITLDCSQGTTGTVYAGKIPFSAEEIILDQLPKLPIDLMINLADPARAYSLANLPIDGVGLTRIEFIISTTIKIHPLALLYPDILTAKEQKEIDRITRAYPDKKQFFIDLLAHGIGTIASAFYPKPVIVRLSDFKTNEYRNLIGGIHFEPHEENPMLGFRGAIRYYSSRYKNAFALECAAIKKVINQIGLTNVMVMVPFVRTLDEGKQAIQEMALHGLVQSDILKIIMMCEIPSNVMLIDEFLQYFDGISIGSNDLTQLTLGADRDSSLLHNLFDERDPAVKKMCQLAIAGAKKAGKYSGICGQAPSDYPELAEFLIETGIDSISLNPDSVIAFLIRKRTK